MKRPRLFALLRKGHDNSWICLNKCARLRLHTSRNVMMFSCWGKTEFCEFSELEFGFEDSLLQLYINMEEKY